MTMKKLAHIVGAMPGTEGFTMVCFKAEDAAVGTRVYTEDQVERLIKDLESIRYSPFQSHMTFRESIGNAISRFRAQF